MNSRSGKPELADGYMQIANELQEAISRVKFTAYEHSLIDMILRLSYGCNHNVFADILYWSDLEMVGIPKQKARQVASDLKDKKVIKITYPTGRIRFRLNKYYLTWKVAFAKKEKIYAERILLNVNSDRGLQGNGNLQVTANDSGEGTDAAASQDFGNPGVTSEDESNLRVTEKVTYGLPQSNLRVTATGAEAAPPAGLEAPKERKKEEKKSPSSISNIVSNIMAGFEQSEEGGNDSSSGKEEARDRSKEVEEIGRIVFASFPNITAAPSDSDCWTAVDKYGFALLKQAAEDVAGNSLRDRTPQGALNYVKGVAKRLKTPGVDFAQRNKIAMKLQDLKADFLKGEAETDLTKFEGLSVSSGNGPVIVKDKEEWLVAMETEISRFEIMLGG